MAKPCYLYVFNQPRLPRIKIGYSNTVERRRREIERETKLETVLMWTKKYRNEDAAYEAEQECHLFFKRYRKRGEFFEGIDVRDVKRYINGPSLFWPVVVGVLAVGFC